MGLRWIFTPEELASTPSQRRSWTPADEQNYRQVAAMYIQKLGHDLSLPIVCINTAIVYMHRFYMLQAMAKQRNTEETGALNFVPIAWASLFLAAKVEEEPRKLSTLIFVIRFNDRLGEVQPDSEEYKKIECAVLVSETILLQTLAFDLDVELPHKIIVRKCALELKAPKRVMQTAYFMATDLNILTTFCLQAEPAVIACLCIVMASKYCKWTLPTRKEGNVPWYAFSGATIERFNELASKFTVVYKSTLVKHTKKTIFAKCNPKQEDDVYNQALKERSFCGLGRRRRAGASEPKPENMEEALAEAIKHVSFKPLEENETLENYRAFDCVQVEKDEAPSERSTGIANHIDRDLPELKETDTRAEVLENYSPKVASLPMAMSAAISVTIPDQNVKLEPENTQIGSIPSEPIPTKYPGREFLNFAPNNLAREFPSSNDNSQIENCPSRDPLLATVGVERITCTSEDQSILVTLTNNENVAQQDSKILSPKSSRHNSTILSISANLSDSLDSTGLSDFGTAPMPQQFDDWFDPDSILEAVVPTGESTVPNQLGAGAGSSACSRGAKENNSAPIEIKVDSTNGIEINCSGNAKGVGNYSSNTSRTQTAPPMDDVESSEIKTSAKKNKRKEERKRRADEEAEAKPKRKWKKMYEVGDKLSNSNACTFIDNSHTYITNNNSTISNTIIINKSDFNESVLQSMMQSR